MAATPVRRYDNILILPEIEHENWKETERPASERLDFERAQCNMEELRDNLKKKFGVLIRHFCSNLQVVIVQPVDAGSKSHPFSYAIVAGIERYPLKVTRGMGKKLVDRRSRIKPFIKVVNYNHLMPTRYTLELEGLKGTVTNDTFKEVSQREDAKKTIKKALEDRYTSGKNRWFFTALRTFFFPGISIDISL